MLFSSDEMREHSRRKRSTFAKIMAILAKYRNMSTAEIIAMLAERPKPDVRITAGAIKCGNGQYC